MGWICRNCDHETDDPSEGCPSCTEDRINLADTMPDRLRALPVGSSLQVFDGWSSSRGSTMAVWSKVGPDAWVSLEGQAVTLETGSGEVVQIRRRVPGLTSGFHDKNPVWTTEAVFGATLCEMTYRAWYVVHDVTTTAAKARREKYRDYFQHCLKPLRLVA